MLKARGTVWSDPGNDVRIVVEFLDDARTEEQQVVFVRRRTGAAGGPSRTLSRTESSASGHQGPTGTRAGAEAKTGQRTEAGEAPPQGRQRGEGLAAGDERAASRDSNHVFQPNANSSKCRHQP